jgi:hypothetical protein
MANEECSYFWAKKGAVSAKADEIDCFAVVAPHIAAWKNLKSLINKFFL